MAVKLDKSLFMLSNVFTVTSPAPSIVLPFAIAAVVTNVLLAWTVYVFPVVEAAAFETVYSLSPSKLQFVFGNLPLNAISLAVVIFAVPAPVIGSKSTEVLALRSIILSVAPESIVTLAAPMLAFTALAAVTVAVSAPILNVSILVREAGVSVAPSTVFTLTVPPLPLSFVISERSWSV